jgi:hypothetical protein
VRNNCPDPASSHSLLFEARGEPFPDLFSGLARCWSVGLQGGPAGEENGCAGEEPGAGDGGPVDRGGGGAGGV